MLLCSLLLTTYYDITAGGYVSSKTESTTQHKCSCVVCIHRGFLYNSFIFNLKRCTLLLE